MEEFRFVGLKTMGWHRRLNSHCLSSKVSRIGWYRGSRQENRSRVGKNTARALFYEGNHVCKTIHSHISR